MQRHKNIRMVYINEFDNFTKTMRHFQVRISFLDLFDKSFIFQNALTTSAYVIITCLLIATIILFIVKGKSKSCF